MVSPHGFSLSSTLHEMIGFASCSVVHGNGKALVCHVQRQVLAHNGQASYPNLSLLFHRFTPDIGLILRIFTRL